MLNTLAPTGVPHNGPAGKGLHLQPSWSSRRYGQPAHLFCLRDTERRHLVVVDDHFKAGIKAAMQLLNKHYLTDEAIMQQADIDAYVSSIMATSPLATPASAREAINLQAWILHMMNPAEGWANLRRADYPVLADGKAVYVGDTIDQAFEAGNYTLKTVATTTMGKETSRTMSLTVKPIDGDPIVDDDAQARIQAPGDAVTMNGSNLTNIKKVRINDRLIDVETVSNTSIQFTMPADMPDGQYRLSLLDEVGQSFGGGLVTVFSDALITKGDFMGQSAGPGSILRLYVKRTDTEYAKGCAAVGWADIVNGGTDPNRGDVDITFEDTKVEFKLTKKSMELLNNGNLQVVGHGFDLTKITIE